MIFVKITIIYHLFKKKTIIYQRFIKNKKPTIHDQDSLSIIYFLESILYQLLKTTYFYCHYLNFFFFWYTLYQFFNGQKNYFQHHSPTVEYINAALSNQISRCIT